MCCFCFCSQTEADYNELCCALEMGHAFGYLPVQPTKKVHSRSGPGLSLVPTYRRKVAPSSTSPPPSGHLHLYQHIHPALPSSPSHPSPFTFKLSLSFPLSLTATHSLLNFVPSNPLGKTPISRLFSPYLLLNSSPAAFSSSRRNNNPVTALVPVSQSGPL